MRVSSRWITLLAWIAVVAALAACGGSRRESGPQVPFTQPDVSLRNVQVRGVGLAGSALDLELHVTNPNGYALEDPRVSYRVYLGDVELAKGMTDLAVTVAEHDTAVVRLPATVGYVAMQRAGRELLGTGAAPYRVLGRITVGTPYGRLTFPYDRAGRFATLPGLGAR
jgi:LEA14-like dessication related protein